MKPSSVARHMTRLKSWSRRRPRQSAPTRCAPRSTGACQVGAEELSEPDLHHYRRSRLRESSLVTQTVNSSGATAGSRSSRSRQVFLHWPVRSALTSRCAFVIERLAAAPAESIQACCGPRDRAGVRSRASRYEKADEKLGVSIQSQRYHARRARSASRRWRAVDRLHRQHGNAEQAVGIGRRVLFLPAVQRRRGISWRRAVTLDRPSHRRGSDRERMLSR